MVPGAACGAGEVPGGGHGADTDRGREPMEPRQTCLGVPTRRTLRTTWRDAAPEATPAAPGVLRAALGTPALEMAGLLLGIEPGDEIVACSFGVVIVRSTRGWPAGSRGFPSSAARVTRTRIR